MRQQGWTIVDVRSPGEFAAVRAEGSLNLPLEQVTTALIEKHVPHKKALLICHSGARSSAACKRLSSNADLEVVTVRGGTSAWSRAGLPVIKDNAS